MADILKEKEIEDLHNSWSYYFTNHIFNYEMFHQEASVEIIKMRKKCYMA